MAEANVVGVKGWMAATPKSMIRMQSHSSKHMFSRLMSK